MYIFKDLSKIEGEIEDSINIGGLKNVSGYRINNRKNAILLYKCKCPFKSKRKIKN